MIQVTNIRRVYWYTDWLRGVRSALSELWRSLFGCHHDWDTVHFRHIQDGFVAVNKCRKCGGVHPFFSWNGTWTRG